MTEKVASTRSRDLSTLRTPETPQVEQTILRLTLPATSANLGPGFDALGLALSLYLHLEARLAKVFSLTATGRDAHVTGQVEGNLILATYREVLEAHQRTVPNLAIALDNEIPLGMGCGSSAAALCAGILLANHFGGLGWPRSEILDEAARREGHPDNVAACLLGGLTISKAAMSVDSDVSRKTSALSLGVGLPWRLLLALPHAGLPTVNARQLLPETYSRYDTVRNVQSTALLVGAFALNRPDLLRDATEDRLHQPYRMKVCALLAALLPLAGRNGVHSVTLSGAGPSVLLIVEADVPVDLVKAAAGPLVSEVLELSIASGARSLIK
jgi:homoserine kinase